MNSWKRGQIEPEIITFTPHVEAIFHEGSRIRTQFLIASFVARWARGEPRLSDEVDAVDWIDPVASLLSPTTPELGEVLAIERQRGSKSGRRIRQVNVFDDLRAAGIMSSAKL